MKNTREKVYNCPVGFYDNLHEDFSINFQMNRFYNWTNDYDMLTEMKKVSSKISNYNEFIDSFLDLGKKAIDEGKNLKAAYYLRGAEFYMQDDNPIKQSTRKKFISLINEYYSIDKNQHYDIPYESGAISAYRFLTKNSKGSIVIFGGFDSYVEEMFPICMALMNNGYDVVCFDGPGQGAVLEDSKIPLTHEWEKPVKSVLDFFELSNVTLIGVSLGGYLVLRAAAFESRVKRVIADDICADFYKVLLRQIQPEFRDKFNLLMKNNSEEDIDTVFDNLMNKNLMLNWGVKQGMHITKSKTPYEFMKKIMYYNTNDISSMVTQDVLLLAGQEDHYIPLEQFFEQSRMLTNVRSLTTRMFTRKENAQNHCHIGNVGLSITAMLDWIQSFDY